MRDELGKGQVRLQVNITYYTYIVYVVYGYLYIVNYCIGVYELVILINLNHSSLQQGVPYQINIAHNVCHCV